MIRKKLLGKGGFTLTELIVTVAIVALLGTAVAVGISAAARAYSGVTMSSEASVLCGTLAVELSDELRFAEKIAPQADGSVTFSSRRFGPGVSVDNAGGHVTVGGSEILAKKAYTGLSADANVTFDGNSFEVTIEIMSAGGTKLGSSTFRVAPLAGR